MFPSVLYITAAALSRVSLNPLVVMDGPVKASQEPCNRITANRVLDQEEGQKEKNNNNNNSATRTETKQVIQQKKKKAENVFNHSASMISQRQCRFVKSAL